VSAAATFPPPALREQFAAVRRRTRRATAVSAVVHVLLLLLLWTMKSEPPESEGLVEITWVELPAAPPPAEPAPPAKVTRTAEPEPEPEAPTAPEPEPVEKRFPRELPRAETKPTPQSDTTTRDLVRSKLASVRTESTTRRTQVAALVPKTEVSRPTLAAAAAPPESRPRDLARDTGPPETRPTELLRTPTPDRRKSPELARLLDDPVPTSADPMTDDTLPPREVLAGVSLAGPVADRELVSYRLPDYPEWAKEEAIEGTVQLRFVVTPDGGVKRNVMIEKTSGFEDFDRNAMLALLAWQFEPVGGGNADQWGSITLNYRLDTVP
jgi:TonB family protein